MSQTQESGLFDYGIHNENSDIRAHVSVVHRCLFVFRTQAGLNAIEKFKPPLKPAGQDGVEGWTAEGWLVRLEWIEDLRTVLYHSFEWDQFNPKLPTTRKGKIAVDAVVGAMKFGRFPFWIRTAEEDQREAVQIKGTDIVVFMKQRVQVKCDYRCGPKPEGTGNLFLQKSERNPRKLY